MLQNMEMFSFKDDDCSDLFVPQESRLDDKMQNVGILYWICHVIFIWNPI